MLEGTEGRKIEKIFYGTSSQYTFPVLEPNYTIQRRTSCFGFISSFFSIYFNVDVALGQQREKIQYEIPAAMFSSLPCK